MTPLAFGSLSVQCLAPVLCVILRTPFPFPLMGSETAPPPLWSGWVLCSQGLCIGLRAVVETSARMKEMKPEKPAVSSPSACGLESKICVPADWLFPRSFSLAGSSLLLLCSGCLCPHLLLQGHCRIGLTHTDDLVNLSCPFL